MASRLRAVTRGDFARYVIFNVCEERRDSRRIDDPTLRKGRLLGRVGRPGNPQSIKRMSVQITIRTRKRLLPHELHRIFEIGSPHWTISATTLSVQRDAAPSLEALESGIRRGGFSETGRRTSLRDWREPVEPDRAGLEAESRMTARRDFQVQSTVPGERARAHWIAAEIGGRPRVHPRSASLAVAGLPDRATR